MCPEDSLLVAQPLDHCLSCPESWQSDPGVLSSERIPKNVVPFWSILSAFWCGWRLVLCWLQNLSVWTSTSDPSGTALHQHQNVHLISTLVFFTCRYENVIVQITRHNSLYLQILKAFLKGVICLPLELHGSKIFPQHSQCYSQNISGETFCLISKVWAG